MEFIDLISAYLNENNIKHDINGETITYHKEFTISGSLPSKCKLEKTGTDAWSWSAPRTIRFSGTKAIISGNMMNAVVVELCDPDSLNKIIEAITSDIIPYADSGNLIYSWAVCRPRSSEDRATASGAEDEGSSPSGGIKGEDDG